jgi:nucleoside 2-deoxyribosyltransferase
MEGVKPQVYLCACIQTRGDIMYIEHIRNLIESALPVKVFCPHADVGIASESQGIAPSDAFKADIEALHHSQAILFLYTRLSFGSLVELGIAYERKIPIVALNCTTHATSITHPILQNVLSYEVFEVDEAVTVLGSLISGY